MMMMMIHALQLSTHSVTLRNRDNFEYNFSDPSLVSLLFIRIVPFSELEWYHIFLHSVPRNSKTVPCDIEVTQNSFLHIPETKFLTRHLLRISVTL